MKMTTITTKLRPIAGGDWSAKQCGLKENPGVYDTGNGALRILLVSRDYPGVTRVEFRSYCGREADADWYEADELPGYRYATPEKCAEANRDARAQRIARESNEQRERDRAYEQRVAAERWGQRQRERDAGFSDGSPQMRIGQIVWQWEFPGGIHTVDGASGCAPRWVRLLAARHWPEANGIQVVRVRATCDALGPDHRPIGVRSILLDLSPERMGIDATHIGLADVWCR